LFNLIRPGEPIMEASYIKLSPMPAPFAVAEALLNETKTELSSDSLIHAYHDEVERYAVEQGRRIVRALFQAHMDLRGQAIAVEPVVGKDGQERTHVRPDSARGLVTTVGKVDVPRAAYSGRGLQALHPTDADLNLPTDSYSFEVTRKIAMTAAEQPFDATRKLFAEFTGVHIALRQVEEITRGAARDMNEFYQSGSRVFDPDKTSDILVLSVDQKGIVMRRQDLREQTRLRAEQQEPKLDSRLTK
jgi:hypothetical protein